MENGRWLWFGGVGLISAVGAWFLIAASEPDKTEARAFLRHLLLAEGRVQARGADGAVIVLENARISGVETASCQPDPEETRIGRQRPNAVTQFICLYTVATPEGARFTTALRAHRQPPGGPADTATANPLLDPMRYRVGHFRLLPLGARAADEMLPVPGEAGGGGSGL